MLVRNRALHLILFVSSLCLFTYHTVALWQARRAFLDGSRDFTSFYSAARIVAKGGEANSTTSPFRKLTSSSSFRHWSGSRVLCLTFTRHLRCCSFCPLSLLSFSSAYFLWAAINTALLACVAGLFFQRFNHLKSVWIGLPIALVFSFFPAAEDIHLGQDSILLLTLCTFAYFRLCEGEESMAGCLLGAGLFRFQVVLPLFLYLVAMRSWKAVRAFCLTTVALLLACLLVTGPQGLMQYPRLLWRLNRNLMSFREQVFSKVYPCKIPNLRGLVHCTLSGVLPQAAMMLIVGGLSFIVLAWSLRQSFVAAQAGAKRKDLVFSLGVVTALAVSFHLQLHDLVLLILPVGLLLDGQSSRESNSGWQRKAIVCLACLFYITPLYVFLLNHSLVYLYCWPLLLLGLVIARSMSKAPTGQCAAEAVSS